MTKSSLCLPIFLKYSIVYSLPRQAETSTPSSLGNSFSLPLLLPLPDWAISPRSPSAMKLTFKTLKGEHFALDFPPTATVADLKSAVGEHRSNPSQAAEYKLIYNGKILPDTDTVASASLAEDRFLVVVPPALKKAPKPAAAVPSASDTTPAPAAPPAPPATPAVVPAAVAAAPSAAAAGSGSEASLLTGPAYEASVKRICEMGFGDADAKRAMRAAFNNPDRAIQYLIDGMPPEDPEPAVPSAAVPAVPAPAAAGGLAGIFATPPPEQNAPPQGQQATAPGTPFDMFAPAPAAPAAPAAGGTASAAAAGGNLNFLRQVPQFNVMRRLIQANPALLAQLLQQLGQANPALLSVINQNQGEFVRLINEPVPAGEEGGDEEMAQLAAAMANAGAPGGEGAGGGGGGAAPPGQIYVTEEENQQLTRLTDLGETMGLQRVRVVEAWLACERDENLAANYLFDNQAELQRLEEEEAAADAGDAGDGGAGDGADAGGNPPS